jgi:hypothetical protein
MGKKQVNLLESHPDLAKQCYGWDASLFTAGSGLIMPWKGTCGHLWDAEIKNRSRGQKCPFCTNRKCLHGFNDLKTTDPHIAIQAYEWDPSTVTRGSNTKHNWICPYGHIWECEVKSRTSSKSGCPICGRKKVCADINDLTVTHPKIAAEAYEWNPKNYLSGSNVKKNWKSSCGHIFEARIQSRCTMKSGCPYCSGRKVLKAFNDLASQFPEIAQEAYNWDASEYTKHSGIYKNWKCSTCNHIWEAEIKSRTAQNKTGCPVCKISGFKLDIESYIYLIETDFLLKVGVGNRNGGRIESHKKNGWEVRDLIYIETGKKALMLERKILKIIDDKGIKRGIFLPENKFNGYTESWEKTLYNPKSIANIFSWE